jgi:hypothetical protein
MSRISGDWAALASQHERLLQEADTKLRQSGQSPVTPDSARWAELASQRERLVECSDPLYGLASSPQPSGFRLAATTAA